MSKTQFELGFDKGQKDAQEARAISEKQQAIADIDYVLCGLSSMLQKLTFKKFEHGKGNDFEITTLSKAIFMLNGKKLQLQKNLQDWINMPKA